MNAEHLTAGPRPWLPEVSYIKIYTNDVMKLVTRYENVNDVVKIYIAT